MKKPIIIIAAIIVLIFVVRIILKPDPDSRPVWPDNEVIAVLTTDTVDEQAKEPTRAEIYIDASASMKPYFTVDDKSMVTTLSEIQNLHGENSTDIYFIGNNTPYTGFIDNIIVGVKKQPNSATSTFHDFFADKAAKIDSTEAIVVYLVTDGLLSVGTSDMTGKLAQLRGLIASSLHKKGLACAIFRYNCKYDGPYWDKDHPQGRPSHKYTGSRPYYIIALGRPQSIRWLSTVKDEALNKPEPGGKLFVGIHNLTAHNSKAMLTYGDSAQLQDMNLPVRLKVDLPECMYNLDNQYLKDNASLTAMGQSVEASIIKDDSNCIIINVSEMESLKMPQDSDGAVKATLTVKNVIPSKWTDWNCDDDTVGPDSTTTFGLKTLVEGIVQGIEDNAPLLTVNYKYYRL